MGSVFRKPKGPSAAEIAEANRRAREEADRKAAEERANSQREAEARFAASDERKRQLKRSGRKSLIATPSGYLGVEEQFIGTDRSLLT